MLLKIRKQLIRNSILILALLGGMFGAVLREPRMEIRKRTKHRQVILLMEA